MPESFDKCFWTSTADESSCLKFRLAISKSDFYASNSGIASSLKPQKLSRVFHRENRRVIYPSNRLSCGNYFAP